MELVQPSEEAAPRCAYEHCGKPITTVKNRNGTIKQYCNHICRAMGWKMKNPDAWEKMGTPKHVTRTASANEAPGRSGITHADAQHHLRFQDVTHAHPSTRKVA